MQHYGYQCTPDANLAATRPVPFRIGDRVVAVKPGEFSNGLIVKVGDQFTVVCECFMNLLRPVPSYFRILERTKAPRMPRKAPESPVDPLDLDNLGEGTPQAAEKRSESFWRDWGWRSL